MLATPSRSKVAPSFRYPDFERMSALTAALMLAYVLSEFIRITGRTVQIGAAGIRVDLTLNTQAVVALFTSALAVSGTTWLLSGHPEYRRRKIPEHWVLPGLTAWVLSISLAALPAGSIWWLTLGLGTSFLALVWIAEFITVDPKDGHFGFAANGLTALSFALFLALTINLRAIQTRLVFLLPAVVLPVFFIIARYLALKLQAQAMLDSANRTTSLLAAGTAAIVAAQSATAMHFLPVSALSFGLALLAPIYAVGVLFGNLVEDRPRIRTMLEPAVVLALLWLVAFWLK
jgi:hypothetical protein